ncbi:YhdX family protein [Metabacillus lacus]|nr:YhdX family protein [Metabacillus lacus]
MGKGRIRVEEAIKVQSNEEIYKAVLIDKDVRKNEK